MQQDATGQNTLSHYSIAKTISVLVSPMRIYAAYRFFLAIILIGFSFSLSTNRLWPLSTSMTLSLLYFALASGFFVRIMMTHILPLGLTFLGIIIDIFMITLLEYTAIRQGITLDIILIVSVASGSIIFPNRVGTLIAAIATIFITGKDLFLDEYFQAASDPLRTVVLSLTVFATAWITQILARRLQESQVITESQAINIAQLEQLNLAVIERMNTGIIVFDRNYSIKLLNAAAKRLLELPKNFDINTNNAHSDNAHQESEESFLGLEQTIESLKKWLRHDDGFAKIIQTHEHSVEIKLGFTYLENNEKVLTFIEDLSKIKQQAQQLKLASLGQLAASIAHEIRNPLAALTYSNQLLMESPGIGDSEQKLCEINLRHVQRMNDIVSNVLELSRREAPKTQKVALLDWLQIFVETVFPQYNRINIFKIIGSSDITIIFDETHLQQILTNLVENAVQSVLKHRGLLNINELDQQSQCVIQESVLIYCSQRSIDDLPVIEVADQGSGITLKNSQSIFEPFFSTSTSGSGLGLFICKEMCDLNGARIYLAPKSTFPEYFGASFQIQCKFPPQHQQGIFA